MRDTALRKITAFESVDKDVGRASRSAWNPELIDLVEEKGKQKKSWISIFFSFPHSETSQKRFTLYVSVPTSNAPAF